MGSPSISSDESQEAYLKGTISMSGDRLLVKRNAFNLFDVVAIVGGFMFGLFIILYMLSAAILSLYTRLKVITSVFHISAVQESKALAQPINIQIKTELSTRLKF